MDSIDGYPVDMLLGIARDFAKAKTQIQQVIDNLTDEQIQADIDSAPEGWLREHRKEFYKIFRPTPCGTERDGV